MFFIVFLILQVPVLNEVLENPQGPESGSHSPGDCNEYVEIFNPGPDTVDLSRYYLEDTRERDSLRAFGDSTILEVYPDVVLSAVLPPGRFALILDPEYPLADPPYRFPYDIAPNTRLVTTFDTDIGNGLSSGEALYLLDERSDTISIFPGDIVPEEGVSAERRSISDGSIWLSSRWGTSPGRVNSWSLEREIALIDELSTEPGFPTALDSIVLNLSVANLGLYQAGSEKILIEIDGVPDTNEIRGILPLDTVGLEIPLGPLYEGTHRLRVTLLEHDDDSSDDSLSGIFSVGEGPLFLNEVMFDDPVEWVELYNHSDKPLSLSGFYLEDASGKRSKPIISFSLSPGSFLVLTGDSTGFVSRFGEIPLIEVKDMPTFNNDRETIFIKDLTGLSLERVCYNGKLGGGQGVSFERVSTQFDGYSEANWKPSRDPRGATPGEKNSISVEEFNRKKALSLSKRVFSPLKGQVLEIYFNVPFAPSVAKVRIFDVTGRKMMTLEELRLSTQDGYAIWDGKDREGRVPPTGLYLLVVEAKGERGNLWRAKTTFVVTR